MRLTEKQYQTFVSIGGITTIRRMLDAIYLPENTHE